MLTDAQAILTRVLSPYSYDQFFEEIVGRQPLALLGNDTTGRGMLLGSDPEQAILAAFDRHAPLLTSHALERNVPPPAARAVADAEAYRALVREYHERGYTVRIPEANDLSPALHQFTRALEVVLENPVGTVVFWSDAGALAPVHYDEVDLIIIQLVGRKRWFISKDPPTLPNEWKGAGEGSPSLERRSTIDVSPGDLVYLPRGTPHTVESPTPSIHLSIGFVPLTVRAAMVAALDHLSDLDKPLRAGVTARADDLARGAGAEHVAEQVRQGVAKLLAACQSDEFVRAALARRRSRMISDLPRLKPAAVTSAITMNSTVRHSPLAVAQLVSTPDNIDFSQPGEHILVHPGAAESLRFIAQTAEFRVAEVPGVIDDEVRIALVNRLLTSGFLELA